MTRKDRQIALWISCLLLLWSWWDFVWFADYLPATWRDALLLMAFAALAACGAVAHDWYLHRTFRSATLPRRYPDEEGQEISLLAIFLAPSIAGLLLLLLISPLFLLSWLLRALPLWLVEATLAPVVALAIGAGLAGLRLRYRRSREESAEDLSPARMPELALSPGGAAHYLAQCAEIPRFCHADRARETTRLLAAAFSGRMRRTTFRNEAPCLRAGLDRPDQIPLTPRNAGA